MRGASTKIKSKINETCPPVLRVSGGSCCREVMGQGLRSPGFPSDPGKGGAAPGFLPCWGVTPQTPLPPFGWPPGIPVGGGSGGRNDPGERRACYRTIRGRCLNSVPKYFLLTSINRIKKYVNRAAKVSKTFWSPYREI